jgi:hypothetical protein
MAKAKITPSTAKKSANTVKIAEVEAKEASVVEVVKSTPAEGKDAKTGRFVLGHNGGPGRKKGSRSRLAESFMDVLRESFEEAHANGKSCGAHAVRRVRDEDPATYTKIVANLLPKQIAGEDGEPIRVELTAGRARLVRELDAIAEKEAARISMEADAN